MRFGVLGPVEAWNEADRLNLGAPLQRCVAAILLLEVNKLVPADRLVDLLWGEQPPRTAAKNVQGYVHRLRRILGDAPDARIRTLAPGYLLEADPDRVDVHRFRRLVAQARTVDDTRATAMLTEALQLWRGPAFADVVTEPLRAVADQLAEEQLVAVATLAEARLRLGRHAELVPELSDLVLRHPLREHLRELLMVALFQSDRRADALQVFRTGYDLLVGELGIGPGMALRKVHEQILRGDPEFDVLAPKRPGPPVAREPASPYPGLNAYSADQARYFFGRGELTNRLVERLNDPDPLVLLVGASGAGKSSLLRAGLIAHLSGMDLARSGRWRWLLLTPDVDPVGRLSRQLAPVLHLAPEVVRGVLTDPARLAGAVRSARTLPAAPNRVVLVVDQFEELFTHCENEAERALFVRALRVLASTDGWMPVVLGLRADFYGDATAFPDLRQAAERPFLVGAMTRDELRQVIDGPAKVAGLTVDDALTELLLHELGDHGEGALPLLSYALLATWEHREGRRLTLAGYYATGGIRGAVAKTADDTFHRFDPASRLVVRELLLRLVRVDPDNQHTRRRLPLAELLGAGDPDSAVTRYVLDKLVHARLVIVDGDAVEIAHEALIRAWPRLGGWIDADRAGLLIRQQLSADSVAWERHGRDPAFLYTDSRLADARALAHERRSVPSLGALEQQFLAASEHRERRAVRRRKLVTAVLVVISVLALAAGGVAVWQRNTVEQQRNDATSRAAAVQIITVLNTDPGLAAKLSLAAYRASPTLEARSALLSSSALPRVTRMIGHSGPLEAIAVASKAAVVATAGADGTVRLWDLATRHQIAALPVHQGEIRAAAFSTDGRVLFTAGADGTISGWDVTDPAKAAPAGTPLRVPGQVTGLAVVPAANLLVATSSDGSVLAWDVSRPGQPAPIPQPARHDGSATTIAAAPAGTTIATGGSDGAIQLWNVDASRHLVPSARLTGHAGRVTSIAFSPDGKVLASGGQDSTARLWTAAGPIGAPLIHHSPVNAVAFSPDGRILATGSDDHVVTLYDAASSRILRPIPHPESVRALGFTGDGQLLLTGADTGALRAWQLTGPVLPGSDPVTSVAFSPDGRILATAAGAAVTLWNSTDPHRLVPLGPLLPEPVPVTSVAFSGNGKILAAGGADGGIRLWDLGGPGPPRPLGDPLGGPGSPVATLSFSADGALLAGGSPDGVRLWDVHNPATARAAGQLPGTAGPAIFAPGGSTLAAIEGGRKLGLWDVHDPAAPSRVGEVDTRHDGAITALAYDQQGRMLATAGTDKTIRLWDVTRTDQPAEVGPPITGHSATVQAVRFAASSTLLSAGQDGSLMVWDLHDPSHAQQQAAMFSSSALTGLATLAVGPDGHTVAVGTANATVVGDVDPDQVAHLICTTDSAPMTTQEWKHYFPDTPQQQLCP